jgi:hypothetical protein
VLPKSRTRARTIYAVDKDSDRAFEAGVVADGADTADTRRTVRFVTGRRNQQRGRDLVEVANVGHSGALERFGGHGDRHVGQDLLAPLRGYDDDIAIPDICIVDKVGISCADGCNFLRQRSSGHAGERAALSWVKSFLRR